MSLWWKIVVGIVVVVLGGAIYYVGAAVYTWRHIPEAYAAWDTGTLLVEYMKLHEDKWPASWDELWSVTREYSGRDGLLRGPGANNGGYLGTLQSMVAVDWTFDPQHDEGKLVVTRPGGKKFPVVWEGAEPNEVVRAYLRSRGPATVPSVR